MKNSFWFALTFGSLLSMSCWASNEASPDELDEIARRSALLDRYVRLLELDDKELRCNLASRAQSYAKDLASDRTKDILSGSNTRWSGQVDAYRNDSLAIYRTSRLEQLLKECGG